MNTNLVPIVKQIIAQYGEAVLGDPKRLKPLFSDLAKDEPKPLRAVFGRCIQSGAYMALKTAPDAPERASRKAAIAQRVHHEYGIDPALSAEALDILEAALFGGQSYNPAYTAAPQKTAPKRNNILLYALAAAAALVMIVGILAVSRRDTPARAGEYQTLMTMKERVKAAGGNVDGTLRFSIQWNDRGYNPNDFDAHCTEPDGNEIYFGGPDGHPSGGNLDVDIIDPLRGTPAVENITWPSAHAMQEGSHTFFVHCFSHNGGSGGFSAEIEYDGQIYPFTYDRELQQDEIVIVGVVNYSQNNGFELLKPVNTEQP